MFKVTIRTVIARPTADVFAYISNIVNNATWQRGVLETYFTTDPPVRVGSEYAHVARFLVRNVESTFKVIEYEPGRLIKATTIKNTFPITFTRIVEPAVDGCTVTAIVEGDADGIFKLAEPLLAKRVKSSVEKDYATLKSILEKK